MSEQQKSGSTNVSNKQTTGITTRVLVEGQTGHFEGHTGAAQAGRQGGIREVVNVALPKGGSGTAPPKAPPSDSSSTQQKK